MVTSQFSGKAINHNVQTITLMVGAHDVSVIKCRFSFNTAESFLLTGKSRNQK